MARYYETIEEIKEANHRAGKYFFSAGALKAFHSRVLPTVYGGKYFITSEKFTGSSTEGPRVYTIREVRESGDVMTVGNNEKYPTRQKAIKAVTKLVENQSK